MRQPTTNPHGLHHLRNLTMGNKLIYIYLLSNKEKIVVEAYGTLVTGPSMVSDGVHIPSTEENFEKLTLLGALSNHLFLYNYFYLIKMT